MLYIAMALHPARRPGTYYLVMRHFALVFLMLAATLAAQEETPVFRTTSELVLVDVQVRNTRTGGPAPALRPADFRISEEGVPQQILQFSRDEYPLSAVLLFDLTDSVQDLLKRLAEGARTALEHFKPADEVAVMVYSGHAVLIDGFTTDRARTIAAIGKATAMTSDEPAYFNEGVYQAATQLQQAGATSRHVIIWLTDNLPNVPTDQKLAPHTEIEAFRALHESNVVVAPILIKSAFWAAFAATQHAFTAGQAKTHPPGDARRYAELTGGQAVTLRGKRPEERLAQLIDELRARYTIGYRPSDPQPAGTFRRIHVELAPSSALRPREWTVMARQGYYRK